MMNGEMRMTTEEYILIDNGVCPIKLTRINMSGLADMHEYSIIPEFYKYLEFPPFTKISQTRKYLKNLISISRKPTGLYWFIRLADTNKVIGTFGLVNIDKYRLSAEIGYGISPKYWDKGYFTTTLSAVVDLLFNESNFHRISAKTQANNIPSISGLKRCGFKKEAVLKKFYLSYTGKRYDAVIFSKINE